MKIHFCVELDPQDRKSSHEQETASFCAHFNTNPPRLEADRQSKSKHLQKILLKSMLFWPELQSNNCHFLLLKLSELFYSVCSDELYCRLDQSGVAVAGATNTMNTRQSEAVTVSLFFLPLHSHAINSTTPTHRHFVLFPVSLATRDKDGGCLLNSMIDLQYRSKLWDHLHAVKPRLCRT